MTTDTILPTYRPSGVIGARAFFVAFLVGIPLAVLLGAGLAWLHSKVEGPIESAICTFLAAAVIGFAIGTLADWARSRHVRANTWGTVLLMLVLLATRWSMAERFPGEGLYSHILATPAADWWEWACGAMLEAIGISIIALILSRSQAREPFNETMRQWSTKGMAGELWTGTTSVPQVLSSLQEKGVDALLCMPLAAEVAGTPLATQWHTVAIEGRWVPDDPGSRWLTVSIKTHTRKDDGKIKVSREDVITNWHISDAAYQALNTHLTSSAATDEPRGAEEQVEENADDDDASRPTPVELQPALAALEAEQYAAACSLAQAHCQHPDPHVQADAWRMCALAHSRLSQWHKAFDHYHALYELEPSTLNALQLATTSVMAGEPLRGDAWFDKACRHNDDERAMPPARMRTAYLSALEQAGEFEAARLHLDWLVEGYAAMGITDDHFVWMRGFPFLGEFLRKSGPLLSPTLSQVELQAWYARLRERLDPEGQQAVDRHLTDLGTA